MKTMCFFTLTLLGLLSLTPAHSQEQTPSPMILTVRMKGEWNIHADRILREESRWRCYGKVRLESNRGDVLLGDYAEIQQDQRTITIMPLKSGSTVRSTILPTGK